MKPKIAVIAGPPDSATHKVMADMLPYWTSHFDVTVLGPDPSHWPNNTLNEFDLLHFSWLGFITIHQQFSEPPITANVWQVGELQKRYKTWFDTVLVNRVVIDDKFTKMQLGQMNYLRTVEIPLTRAFTRERLGYPKKFTLGYFGNAYPSKRFSVADAAAASMKIPVASYGLRFDRPVYSLSEKEVYEAMSVLVHSSFHDTNSLVAMEAMSYGRPVIAVWSPGLARTLKPGYNGYFYDGTIEDLIAVTKTLQSNYNYHAYSAMETVMPNVKNTADQYTRMFNEVLDSE